MTDRKQEMVTLGKYLAELAMFDAALCEAIAVSQAISHRKARPHVGYASRVFAKICSQAIGFIRACPRSRWVQSEYDFWDFSIVSGHCRSIIEGQLLLWYLMKEPTSDDELAAKINVMYLNDCVRRRKILESQLSDKEIAEFMTQADELRGRLTSNSWFVTLDPVLQKRLLIGDYLTISDRDSQLKEVGWDKGEFYMIWNLLSQYTHVLPLSFFRMEPNGRGTGVENDTDRSYVWFMLETCANVLVACTNKVVLEFPDAASVRKGMSSKFSPGPGFNRP